MTTKCDLHLSGKEVQALRHLSKCLNRTGGLKRTCHRQAQEASNVLSKNGKKLVKTRPEHFVHSIPGECTIAIATSMVGVIENLGTEMLCNNCIIGYEATYILRPVNEKISASKMRKWKSAARLIGEWQARV